MSNTRVTRSHTAQSKRKDKIGAVLIVAGIVLTTIIVVAFQLG